MNQERGSDVRWRRRLTAAAALLSLMAIGCKSGMSSSKPAWWTFGSQTGDPSKLAAAPPFGDGAKGKEGDVAKPSSLASPYPTTSTPDGYALNAAPAPQLAAGQPSQYPATDSAAPITYGQPQPAAAAAMASATPSAPMAQAPGPIAAQAGPYATMPAPQVATAPPTPAAAAQSEVSLPETRFADNRGGDAWGSPAGSAPGTSSFTASAAAPAAAVPAAGDSRYGQETGSRFAGTSFSAPSSPLPRSAAPASPIVSESAPPVFTPVAPSAAPGATVPPSPPRRRPDPGYRPGGTSSYRPSRSILVGDPTVDSAVRTAGFEAPAEPVRQ